MYVIKYIFKVYEENWNGQTRFSLKIQIVLLFKSSRAMKLKFKSNFLQLYSHATVFIVF